MCEVINLRNYMKARRGPQGMPRRATRQPQGLVSIGLISAEIVRRMKE